MPTSTLSFFKIILSTRLRLFSWCKTKKFLVANNSNHTYTCRVCALRARHHAKSWHSWSPFGRWGNLGLGSQRAGSRPQSSHVVELVFKPRSRPNPDVVTSALLSALETFSGCHSSTEAEPWHSETQPWERQEPRQRWSLPKGWLFTSPSDLEQSRLVVLREAILGLKDYFGKASVISEFNDMKLDLESSNKPISKLQYPWKWALPLDLRPLRIHLCVRKIDILTLEQIQNIIFIQYNFLNSFYPISQFFQIFETEIKLSS